MNIKTISPTWDVPIKIKSLITTKYFDFGWDSSSKEQSVRELSSICNNKFIEQTIWLQQEHGINIVELFQDIYPEVNKTTKGYSQNIILNNNLYQPKADAVFTRAKNKICAILTADCLPILITNKAGSMVCAIHAGWRGLVQGIIENSIIKLAEHPSNILVYLGPAIGPDKFEVGGEVRQVFIKNAKNIDLVESSFVPLNNISTSSKGNCKPSNVQEAIINDENNKYLANMHMLARDRLLALGVLPEHIFQDSFCTYSQDNLFHSYRRDKTKARMASLIWID